MYSTEFKYIIVSIVIIVQLYNRFEKGPIWLNHCLTIQQQFMIAVTPALQGNCMLLDKLWSYLPSILIHIPHNNYILITFIYCVAAQKTFQIY